MGDDEQSLRDGELAGQEVGNVDPWVGQYLADYYIIRRIGEGGMGIVYLARHQSLDRLAAVKFLGAHMVTDTSYIERFLNEARGAAKLNHPNVVAVYDAGSLGENVYYFIMEYIEGRDLGTMLRERHVFPVPESVGYIRQAAAALGYAHKKRIIHRDIKPDNLMLTNDGTVKVGDLGLAKWISDDGSGGMTQSGIVMGTPFYISPEQVRGSRDVDARSDIYSLGATLYHMVAGRIPYEGTSPAVIMAMHLNNPVPEPNRANPSLDADISGIIKKMMAKNAADRFQTMEDVDVALADYQAGKMRSAQFAPGAVAPLPFSPATEPQQIPSGPPERTQSPNILQSEPGAPVKIATIIGMSIIVAAVILGFFLSSVVSFKGKEQADAPAAPQPAAPTAQAQPSPKAQPSGFVPGAAPTKELKIPESLPPSKPEPVAQHAEAPPAPQPPTTPAANPVPDQHLALAPSSPFEGMQEPRQPPPPPEHQIFSPEPDRGPAPSPDTSEIIGVMQNGEMHPMFGPMEQSVREILRAGKSYFGQDFSTASPGSLPKGVECMLVDMANRFVPEGQLGRKKNEISVGPSGYKIANPRCEATWSIESDDTLPGKKYLRLRHDTDAYTWLFGAKFDSPTLIRNKKFMLVYLLRAGQQPPRVEFGTMPDSGMMPPVPIDTRWKYYVIPKPQMARSDFKSMMVGVQGVGEVHIADIRVVPIPKELESMFDRQPNNPPPMGTGMGTGGRTIKRR